MVFAFAGDSTITSFLPVDAAIQRATIAPEAGSAILAAGDPSPATDPDVLADRRPLLADPGAPVPLPRPRHRESARRGRLCPGRRARLEPRSVAARPAALAAPVPAVHGEVRAVLVPALPRRLGRRRVQGEPRPVRPRGDRDRRQPRAGGERDRDVPRRDAPQEGAAEEARGPGSQRRGADRAGGRRPPRPRRDQGDGRAEPARALARLVRATGRPGRPPRPETGGGGQGGYAGHDGRDPPARGVAVSRGTLLAIDGDWSAPRAYDALPKSIRLNAIVGFSNFLLRLWDAEQPESVLVGWDSLETPTYRHEALPEYQSGRVFEPSILEQLNMLPA